MHVLHCSKVSLFQGIQAHPPYLYVTLSILFQPEDEEGPLSEEDSDDSTGVPPEALVPPDRKSVV